MSSWLLVDTWRNYIPNNIRDEKMKGWNKFDKGVYESQQIETVEKKYMCINHYIVCDYDYD